MDGDNRLALIPPYGGNLVDLVAADGERDELTRCAATLPYVQLTDRNLCDLELLATGGLSPLDRFIGERDYHSVLENMRLADGTLYPIPVLLPIPEMDGIRPGAGLALRNSNNNLLAVMQVEEVFERDPRKEALQVCGTTDEHHPLVAEMRGWGKFAVSGPVKVLARSSTSNRQAACSGIP